MATLSAGLSGSSRFSGSSQNYSSLLLEEEAGLLYVGGRGVLYALNSTDISTPANPGVSQTPVPSSLSSHFSSAKRGQTNNSLKQIEQILLWSSNFMDMGLNAPGIYSMTGVSDVYFASR